MFTASWCHHTTDALTRARRDGFDVQSLADRDPGSTVHIDDAAQPIGVNATRPNRRSGMPLAPHSTSLACTSTCALVNSTRVRYPAIDRLWNTAGVSRLVE